MGAEIVGLDPLTARWSTARPTASCAWSRERQRGSARRQLDEDDVNREISYHSEISMALTAATALNRR
jgi:hypothetical protein